jgi:mannose-1-phosphate guanylyltransferase/mannose-6-phosphate isomerase
MRNGDDPILFVLPSDHTIADQDAFAKAAGLAARAAASGKLVTFGIRPDRPETGYGYVKVGSEIIAGVHAVDTFREKPDAATAANYLASGDYLWNSGMFMFRASVFLTQLMTHAPQLAARSQEAWELAVLDGNRVLLDEASFAAIDGDSIDYSVMERTSSAAVVPADPGWNDVGSWASLWDVADKDGDGNVTSGDVFVEGVTGSLIRGGQRLVAVVGIDDVVVVDTDDALLVASRDRSQEVKAIVDTLQTKSRPEYSEGPTMMHPWGTDRIDAQGPGYIVRHISLDPDAETPIYSDTETSTRWHILAGNARLTIGEATVDLDAGSAVVAAEGVGHRLTNVGNGPLEAVAITVGVPDDEDERRRYLTRYARVEREV